MVPRMRREGLLTGQRFSARETRDLMHEAISKETFVSFLKTAGDLLITGPTLTNVMDLRLILIV